MNETSDHTSYKYFLEIIFFFENEFYICAHLQVNKSCCTDKITFTFAMV